MDRPGRPQASKYACKLCRRVLFEADDLMDHVPERHQIAMRRVRASAYCLSSTRELFTWELTLLSGDGLTEN